jgi:hypothetical protein
MIVTMSDGRTFALTRRTGKSVSVMTEKSWPEIWQAESPEPRKKMHASWVSIERGFGPNPQEAIADAYRQLDDSGMLDDARTPCPDCGRGYRVLAVSDSYIPHGDKCPAEA